MLINKKVTAKNGLWILREQTFIMINNNNDGGRHSENISIGVTE